MQKQGKIVSDKDKINKTNSRRLFHPQVLDNILSCIFELFYEH